MKEVKNIIIVFNKNFYKEIDIDNFEEDEITIGLKEENTVKLNLDINMNINMIIRKSNNYWEFCEGENIYSVINGIKTSKKKLIHGDQLAIKLKSNKIELFKINFFVDFASGKENYDKIVYLEKEDRVNIGSGNESNILINDDLVDKNHCYLNKDANNSYSIVDLNSRYSIYINGKKVEGRKTLNKNDFIIICGYKLLFMGDRILLTNYNDKISVRGLKTEVSAIAKSDLVYPEFIRAPRYRYNLPKEEIEIVEPPALSQKPNWEMFVPLISTIATSSIYTFLMPGSGMLGMATAGVTVGTTALMYGIRSKQFVNEKKDRNNKYLNYIETQDNYLMSLREEQIRISNILYPKMKESVDTLNEFKIRLWEKQYYDDDFLKVSLGSGTVETTFEVKIPKEQWGKTDDELILKPKEIKEKYKEIENLPITVDLKNESGIAILGKRELINNYVYSLLMQIVTYHHYEDVKIVFIYDEEEDNDWRWIRWLPHVWDNSKKIRFIGKGKESAHVILPILNDMLNFRKADEDGTSDKKLEKPHFLFFVTNPELLNNEQIATYIESKETIGYTPIFLYESLQIAPNNCSCIVNITDSNNGTIRYTKNAEKIVEFNYEEIIRQDYEEFSRRMAPVYVKETFSASSLPKVVTLYDLYAVNSIKEIPIIDNWNKNDVCKTIAAPLGVNMSGDIIDLNIHEKFHGPHGLVAGTTGSGKSEILQSFIISLAINFHPYDVSFILIDYKGGGMANLFKDLPHLIGTITNLDGNAVNRSLALIKSELKRRQRIFSKYDVNHIDGYKKLEKKDNLEPLPHLVIIADEFAELKSNQPEFMSELVSAARIGRSLGVHLILATQKPSGVVDDQIWSNSKFKLCLKVQDAGDSNELLKKPDAANIVEPGRAYFQVGNDEIYELFQSAWSGAKKYEDDEICNSDIEVSEVSIEGMKRVLYSSKEALKGKKAITQLEDSINHLNKVFSLKGYKKIDDCWVPPLENIVYLNSITKEEDCFYNNDDKLKVDIKPIVGIYDSPERQKKLKYSYNFTENGNLIIIGSPGYGKTTLLQTLIMSLTLNYSPKDVNIYILDFGTRTLKIFEKSVHVGGVVLSDDDEKLHNLIKIMKKEILDRKDEFSKYGASNLVNYRVASGNYMPQIIIFIDNYIGFKETFEDYEDDFNYFAREGATLGINIVATGNSSNNISFRFLSNFKMKGVFTCIDSSEYSSVFNKSGLAVSNIKGRLLTEYGDSEINEMQVALPSNSEEETERVNEIKETIEKIKRLYKGKIATAIPRMPESLRLDEILSDINGKNNHHNETLIPCGFSNDLLENRYVKINDYGGFVIVGDSKSGKTNILKNIIDMDLKLENNTKFIIFDDYTSSMKSVSEYKNIMYYSKDKDNYQEIFEFIESEGEKRKELIFDSETDFNINDLEEIIILIDNIGDFVSVVELESEYSEIMNKVAKEYKEYKISIVAAGKEDDFNNSVYSVDFVKVMKDNQQGILLNYIENQRFFDVQLRYGMKEKEIKKGDGYYINKNYFDRIKVPRNYLL